MPIILQNIYDNANYLQNNATYKNLFDFLKFFFLDELWFYR